MFTVKKHCQWLVRRYFDRSAGTFLEADAYKALRDILRYSSSSISFYQGRGERLADYPIIDKHLVQEAPEQFTNPRIIKYTGYTSGTTGTPSRYYRDMRSIAAEQYFQHRYFGWKGKYLVVLRGERFLRADSAPARIYLDMPLIRECYVSSYHLSDNTLGSVVEKLRSKESRVLWAYPSAACALAEYCLRTGARLSFGLVATSSEQLFQHQVALLEEAFDCRVKDWYGQGERVVALYRCEEGHYHEVPGYSCVEYREVGPGLYELVGTTLYNRSMPLIRFNTGDRVEIAPEKCACGAGGRNIVSIHGRQSDYLDLPSGRVSGGLLNVMFKKVRNIREAQVIQRSDKHILVKIVRSNEYQLQDERLLAQWIKEFIPQDMCHIVYVERIDKDRNGKFRFVINEGLRMDAAGSPG